MELQISMIPSPEDASWRSNDYQSELRDLGSTLRAGGLEIHDLSCHPASKQATSPVYGEWSVPLCASLAPILETPVGSWLQAKRGRTVRMKIGEIEADVRTVAELIKVIGIAKFYQEASENGL